MAGAGYREFQANEVLTSANVNTYLMEQSVMVFGGTAARGSAISSPSEGMFTFLTDSDALEYYDGSAWTAFAVGDITQVTAGTALTGGGSSGDVTLDFDFGAAPTLTSSASSSYTVATTDAGKYLQFTGSVVTLTVGSATDFTTGQQVTVLNDGGTALTIIPEGSGVELYGRGTAQGTAGFVCESQYEAFTILCVGTDAYRIIGNVVAN